MLAAATALAFTLVAQALANNDCTRTYVVKDGDICDEISFKYNVSTYQLSAVNDCINEDCSNLIPDQELCLGRPGEDCNTIYKVVLNDTYSDIATKHKIDSAVLLKNNPQIYENGTNLYVGEILCVASTVMAPPMPSNKVPASGIPVTASPADPTHSGLPSSPGASGKPNNPSGYPSGSSPGTVTSTSYKTVSTTPGAPAPTTSNPSGSPAGTGSVSPPPTPSKDSGDGDGNEGVPYCD